MKNIDDVENFDSLLSEQKLKLFNTIRKESKIKECFYFDHTKCSDTIIKAHSIQKNKILNRISENGMVVAFDSSRLPFIDIKELGKSKASVFTGFCGYHDNELFKEIENKSYENTPLQNFLYAYRAFAKETHAKKEVKKLIDDFSQIYNFKSPVKSEISRQLSANLNTALTMDKDFINDEFKYGFIQNDYSKLLTKTITLDYAVNFTVATAITPIYDIIGKKINDLKNIKKPLNFLFINIFPEEDKTYLLFSWFRYSNSVYRKWFYQFLNLTEQQRTNFLNRFIPLQAENFYISPRLWNIWNENEKQIFRDNFAFPIMRDKVDYKQKTLYNLFEKI